MGSAERDRLLAAARAAHRAHRYAEAHRDLVAASADESLPDDDLRLLADAAWWLGRVKDFLSLTEELHQRFVSQGRVDRAALHALDLAGTFFMRGEPAMGSGWLSRARRLVEDQPRGPAHALLLYIEASSAIEEQRLETATSDAQQLQELGRDLDDPTYGALGLLCEGLVQIQQGRLAQGFALIDEAMLPVIAGTVQPEFAGNIYCVLIAVCEDLADLSRARQWTAATERWLESFPDAVMFNGVCRAHRVQLRASVGDWDRAVAEAEQVLVELVELNQDAMAEADYQLGEIHRVHGRHDQAASAYARAAARGRDPQPGAALQELASGRAAEAWAVISAAVASATNPIKRAPLLRAQVEIGLRAGHQAAARSAYERLRAISETYPSPGFLAWADEAQGSVLLAEGDAAGAVPPLEAAALRFHRMDSRVDAAVAERLVARAHRALGNTGEAETHEGAAAALYAALGFGSGPAADPLPGGLTHREVQVLVRVAAGASNREVGADLFLSEATVRRHLANIYRKLEVTSRTAASAWAHRRGLHD